MCRHAKLCVQYDVHYLFRHAIQRVKHQTQEGQLNMKKLLVPTSVVIAALLAALLLRLGSPQQALGQAAAGRLNVLVLSPSVPPPGIDPNAPGAVESFGPLLLDLNTGNVWHVPDLTGKKKPTFVGKLVILER